MVRYCLQLVVTRDYFYCLQSHHRPVNYLSTAVQLTNRLLRFWADGGFVHYKRVSSPCFLVWSQSLIVIITLWFAIALDEIRTRRILREKVDCKQSRTICVAVACVVACVQSRAVKVQKQKQKTHPFHSNKPRSLVVDVSKHLCRSLSLTHTRCWVIFSLRLEYLRVRWFNKQSGLYLALSSLYSLLSLINGHLHKTDTSVKRTSRVCPCLSLLPLFDSL